MSVIMEENTVLLSGDGQIRTLTINRPKSLNALNPDLLQSLILSLEKLSKAEELRALIITGAGEKAFVAGADISSMHELGPRAIADYVELGQRAMRAIERFKVPVIAAVNGYALGGGLELALACDLIFASSAAKLGQPEVNLGIIPGFGGTQRLIHRAGVGLARRLCYSGELISAEEGLRVGLVDKVFAPEELIKGTTEYASQIAKKSPLAVAATKAVIRNSQEQSLNAGLRLEVEAFLDLFKTADREEGMAAFLAKREPKFTGK